MVGEAKKSRLFSALLDVLRRPSMRYVVRYFTDAHVHLYRATFWPKLVAMFPYFVDYQQRTQREIPVIILRRCSPFQAV